MLHDTIWRAITTPKERDAMLCVSCASRRLGRPLTDVDFCISPVAMVARLLAIRLAEMTYEERQRILNAREEVAAQFPDIQAELSAFIERLFAEPLV